jgi:hypothetical protein
VSDIDPYFLVSLKLSVVPVAVLRLPIVSKEFSSAVSHSLLEITPIDTKMVDVSSPTVIDVVLKLTLINEVIYLTSDSLKLTVFIDLAESALDIIFADSEMVVDWRRAIFDNIFGI